MTAKRPSCQKDASRLCLAGRVTVLVTLGASVATLSTLAVCWMAAKQIVGADILYPSVEPVWIRLTLSGFAWLCFVAFWLAYGALQVAQWMLQPLDDVEEDLKAMVAGQPVRRGALAGSPEFRSVAYLLHKLRLQLRSKASEKN